MKALPALLVSTELLYFPRKDSAQADGTSTPPRPRATGKSTQNPSSSSRSHETIFASSTMTSTQLNLIAPLDTPLPPPPDGQVLTQSQWNTLMAIADTVIPSIEVPSTLSNSSLCITASDYTSAVETISKRLPPQTDSNLTQRFLQENASSVPGFRELLQRTLGDYVREDARKGIRVILSALE